MKQGVAECSSLGSPFFSAATAKVSLYGQTRDIDDWYFMSLRFGKVSPKSRFDSLPGGLLHGSVVTHFVVDGRRYPSNMLRQWYNYLWYMYLEERPDVVAALRTYEDFRDSGSDSVRDAGEAIRLYVNGGRFALFDECAEFEWIAQSEGKECL